MERLTTRIVPPIGPLDAKILMIGEAPGAEEDTFGEPFVGSAGQMLKRAMRSIGLLPQDVLITNVFRQRPPNNGVNYFFQDKSNTRPNWEGQEHIDLLKEWLESLPQKPNVVVALGATALKVLCGRKRIEKWRGSILPCTLVEGLKVYPTYHPSFVMRMLNEQVEEKAYGAKKVRQINALPLFLKDLERIVIQSQTPALTYPERKFDINLTLPELLSRLDTLASLPSGTISCDIETLPSAEGPLVWMIGFAESPAYAFTIYLIKGGSFAWSSYEEAKILRAVSRVFLNPNISIAFQGGTYDLAVLGRYYGLRLADGVFQDTMLCHHANYPYIRKGLEVLASIYTWEPYYKDEGKVHYGKRVSDLGEAKYNAKDCCVTREIIPIVQRDSRELATWSGYNRTLSVIPSLLAMMIRGVKIDQDKKARLADDFAEKLDLAQREIERISGQFGINLKSSPQKHNLLYGVLQLPIQYKRGTNRATADKEAIAKLRKQFPDNEVLRHLADYQKFQILKSTFADMQLDSDGRIRTSYGFVSTWRLSSSGSPFIFNLSKKSQAGGNLQNIPTRSDDGRLIRTLFITDDCEPLPDAEWQSLLGEVSSAISPEAAARLVNGRMVWLASDLSQAEARVVAWESEDLEDIEMFLDPSRDIHWERAKIIFQIPDSVKYLPKALFRDPFTRLEHPLKFYRDLGKRIVHATNYDMGPFKLQAILATDEIHIPMTVCRRMMQSYKAQKPFLDKWKRERRDMLNATKTIVSSLGRKRVFPGRQNDDLYRAAYAFSPQNTVGELLEVAIEDIHERVPEAQLLLNIHDEVATQVAPQHLLRTIPKIKESMERPIEIKGRTLLIPCDFKLGVNWGETTEFVWG